MAAPPKYAFITLDQGMSKRDAFVALSQYGDVRLVSKISERSIESDSKYSFSSTAPVVVEPRKVRITRRCLPGMSAGESPPVSNGSLLGKRPHSDMMPEFRSAPTRPQSSLSLPTFSSSLSQKSLSPMQQLQQTLFHKEEEMITDIKTEDVDDGYVHDVNQPFDSLEEAEAAIGMAHEDDDERSTAGHFDGKPDDLDNFIDDEGNIEVPYAPNFKECKTARRVSNQSKPVEKAEQARCEVCRRWVKCTETLSRLISHVFIHAKKQRFVCPVDGCEYSNRTERITRGHIDKNHGGVASPIDSEKDKKSQSEVWKAGRTVWAPRCFPDHFEKAPGGNLFMRINEKSVLME
ncbi:hypothetical protein PRIPAC_76282 [Pristionchus pacificus]|uniref:Uncharacterized protein n=1 Tax=Pristionchus pacificus TaxID=54126 RepID=A0A2A6C8R0_PRIPA|nr:hypothetical protein PRIPAC_76282 [Pristionchus pacificus]|eukprot:PDM74468.1 hypothetical protein PRIPAC_41824 [Pristionchus pacificus]